MGRPLALGLLKYPSNSILIPVLLRVVGVDQIVSNPRRTQILLLRNSFYVHNICQQVLWKYQIHSESSHKSFLGKRPKTILAFHSL